ncbi:MAG: diaminopimelate decarboxylase [Erythrobacter sp.]
MQLAGRDLGELAANVDEPVFVYSLDRIEAKLEHLLSALDETGCDHRAYYAMKANRFEPILERLARSGRCGVDVCSPNELDRALACGFAEEQVSFTGTGVANRDLERLLAHGGITINCDSIGMIRRIGERQPGRAIGIRVNPALGTGYANSDKLTYAGGRTTKFGIYREQWAEALAMARQYHLKVETLHFHVGCGILEPELRAWEEAMRAGLDFAEDLPDLRTVNIGGGLGLQHRVDDKALDLSRWATMLRTAFAGRGLEIATEPGDFLVKDAGVLVLTATDIEVKRDTLFVSVDGGFNLAPEPAFYDLPCEPVPCLLRSRERTQWSQTTIAGNINEALDLWATDIAFPPVMEGDRIALINAGGYASSMSSNHCMRGDFEEIAL